jgi:hypothetical protein
MAPLNADLGSAPSTWVRCFSPHEGCNGFSLGVQASGTAGLACAGAEPGSGVQSNLVRIEDHVDCHREVQVTRLLQAQVRPMRTADKLQQFSACPVHRPYGHPGGGLEGPRSAPASPCLSPISKSRLQSLSDGYRTLGYRPRHETQIDKELDGLRSDLDMENSHAAGPTTLTQAAHSQVGPVSRGLRCLSYLHEYILPHVCN